MKLKILTNQKMNKKGLGVGQVFVFIIAAVTFALIMIFGYKAITEFMVKGENVEFYQFKNDLENSVKRIYTEYGSERVETFHTPLKYEQICFVDMDYNFQSQNGELLKAEIDKLCLEDPLACDVWADSLEARKDGLSGYESVSANVFLTPQSPVPIKIYQISIVDEDENPQGFLCEPIREGVFNLILTGKGDHTELARKSLSLE